MKAFHFFKASGSGNDFIVADNREGILPLERQAELARALCPRQVSVGADGLILLENQLDSGTDFAWRFYNADGSVAEMCGNGARCAARVAFLLGIAGPAMSFSTLAGVIRAEVDGKRVKVEMPRPEVHYFFKPLSTPDGEFNLSFLNTGVPHVVCLVNDLEKAPVMKDGRMLRFHEAFQPAGTNVNFVLMPRGGDVHLRTYERGVEDETLACGTGAVAAALVRNALDATPSPIRVHTRGGEVLLIHFSKNAGKVTEVFLEGATDLVYEADLLPDVLENL